MRNRAGVFFVVFISLLTAAAAWAQVSTSSITGLVTDSSTAIVPGASVQAKNEDTGVAHDTTTTASGVYSFAALPPGPYTITVSNPGFQTFSSSHNVLTVGAPLVMDVVLKVGATSETVRVES